MPQALRTEYIYTVADPAVARREPLEWWEMPPGGFIKEKKIAAALREVLAERWRRLHAQAPAVRCGDSWEPMFVRVFNLV